MSNKRKLTKHDYANAAHVLGVPVAAVYAVTEVESRGDGFLPTGHPVILFERHIMWRQVRGKYGAARADALTHAFPNLINTQAGGYGKTSEQPARMDRAASMIDRECALKSASWGLFQIMGFHWEALGYPTLQAFVNAMYRDEAGQLDAFVRFIKANPNLLTALRAQDWKEFARGYNGKNYAINKYDTKLALAYDKYSKEMA